jgi:hypothetical protein
LNPEEFEHNVKGETHEAAFNEACRLTGNGNYEEAHSELARAEKLCRNTFEEQVK